VFSIEFLLIYGISIYPFVDLIFYFLEIMILHSLIYLFFLKKL